MAASNIPIEQVMGKLKIDHSMKPNQDVNGSVSAASGTIGESEKNYEFPAVAYSPDNYYGYSYYYPGFENPEGFSGVPDNQGYYVNEGDGTELQEYPVMVADDGSLVYFVPGFQPGYDPYTSYLPVVTTGTDGQYVAQQPYPLNPVFSPSVSTPCYYPTHIPYGSELVPSYYIPDASHLVGDGVYANGYTTVLDKPTSKPYPPASGHTHAPTNPNSEFRTTGAGNQIKGSAKPKHRTNAQPESVKSKTSIPISKLPSYHESKGGVVYPNGAANLKANERGPNVNESIKTRSKSNDVSDTTLLDEQTNVPKAANVEKALGTNSTTDEKNKSLASVIQRGQYNLPEFPTKYKSAYFFIIKSYSEDDIHKTIKYSVWASTPNGNKKLDNAYQEAQEKTKENGSKCPVFLFYSVNASGQFCGIAEMTGRVDFNKSMDFWQQDKWNGYFPVKWHVIKDVPNPQLRHIILENNENKPVTNSRDTQEVRFPQGIEMLGIFKNCVSKTSILDDFNFYESRQKVMQQKRSVPSTLRFDVLQPKADEWTRVENRVEVKASD